MTDFNVDDEEWLRKAYLEEGRSQNEIAEMCGETRSAVRYRMKKFDIPSRDVGEAIRLAFERGYPDKPSTDRETGKDNPNWIDRVPIVCGNCGSERMVLPSYIERYSEVLEFCKECIGEYHSENSVGEDHPQWDRVEVECGYCGETLMRQPNRVKRNKRNFCYDSDCYALWQSENMNGENSPSYKGGYEEREHFSPSERRRIFERDDYACQDCDKKGEYIEAHHIESVSSNEEKAHDLNNGVTLCLRCHTKRHKGEPCFYAMKGRYEKIVGPWERLEEPEGE